METPPSFQQESVTEVSVSAVACRSDSDSILDMLGVVTSLAFLADTMTTICPHLLTAAQTAQPLLCFVSLLNGHVDLLPGQHEKTVKPI